jgi:hypothetical protein
MRTGRRVVSAVVSVTILCACAEKSPAPTVPSSLPGGETATSSPGPEVATPGSDLTTAGSCAGPCRGRPTPELGPALQVQAARARRCYNEALRQDPTVSGRMVVHLRVAQDGRTCPPMIHESSLPEDLGACVLTYFQNASLPPPRGGCVEARIPIRFIPLLPDGGIAAD